MSGYKFLNETLLDNVDGDDVEDVDVETTVEDFEFNYDFKFSYAKPMANFSKVELDNFLKKCRFIHGSRRVEFDINNVNFSLKFYSCHLGLSDLCELIGFVVGLVGLHRVTVSVHYETQGDDITQSFTIDSDLSGFVYISSKNKFFGFFKVYFPDIPDNRIVDALVGSVAKHVYHRFMSTNPDGEHVVICLQDDYNIIMDGKLLSEEWFSVCSLNFSDGFAKVSRTYGDNYIDKRGNLLSPERWFKQCYEFEQGYGRVVIDKYENLVDINGNVIFKEKFESCFVPDDGLCVVQKDGKWNIAKLDGNYVLDDFAVDVKSLHSGMFGIQSDDDLWSIVDKEGKPITTDRFEECRSFSCGFSQVKKDGKWNYVGLDGKILVKERWFDSCMEFCYGYAIVTDNKDKIDFRTYNFIDIHGNLVSNEWYEHAFVGIGGFLEVRDDMDHANLLIKDGTLFFKNWVHYIHLPDDDNGCAIIANKDKKEKFLTREFRMIPDGEWLDECYQFCGELAKVKKGKKFNYIKKDGSFVFDENDWFIDKYKFEMRGDLLVTRDGTCFDFDGNYVSTI